MNRQNGKVDNTGIMFAMVVLDRANAVKGEFIGVYRNAIINVERERGRLPVITSKTWGMG